MLSSDFAKLKRLLYDYDSAKSNMPQGQAVLEFLNLPKDMTFRPQDIIKKKMYDNFKRNHKAGFQESCFFDALDFAYSQEDVQVAKLVEMIIPCTTPDNFILSKEYVLDQTVEHSFGKWPDQFGNGFYIEAEYILEDLIEMVREKLFADARKHPKKNLNLIEAAEKTVDEYINLFLQKTDTKEVIRSYAMQLVGRL